MIVSKALVKHMVKFKGRSIKAVHKAAHFDIFFNSPKLIEKLFQKGIYGIETVWANIKQMSEMIDDKQMKRGDCEFLFSGNTVTSKLMDNQSVLLLSSALEEMNDILSVQGKENGSNTKSSIPCHKVVKIYISSMCGVDLMDQLTILHIVWIKIHLLDFISNFLSIWWISHVSMIISFRIWSILTNCLSLITRLLSQKPSYFCDYQCSFRF